MFKEERLKLRTILSELEEKNKLTALIRFKKSFLKIHKVYWKLNLEDLHKKELQEFLKTQKLLQNNKFQKDYRYGESRGKFQNNNLLGNKRKAENNNLIRGEENFQ